MALASMAKPPALLPAASELVAGACYEVQKRTSGRNLEVVRVELKVRRGALVPMAPDPPRVADLPGTVQAG
jgi:hypothetical protein